MSFNHDELRSKLQAIEQDHGRRKKGQKGNKDGSGHVISITHEEEPQPGMVEIPGMLQKLTAEVQQLKDGRDAREQQPHNRGNRGYNSGHNRGGDTYSARGAWNQQQQQQQQPQNSYQGQPVQQLDFQGQQPQQFNFQGQGQYRGHRGGYQPSKDAGAVHWI